MKKLFLLSAITFAAALSACSPVDSLKPFDQEQAVKVIRQNMTSKPAQQRISLNLPHAKNWKRIDLSQANKGAPVMLVPIDETESNWKESIRTKIRPYATNPNMNANKLLQSIVNEYKENCTEASANIISQNDLYLTYRLNIENCVQEKNQIQVGKVFNGTDAVYLVNYTGLQGQIPVNQFKKMSSVIASAQLVPDPRLRA